MTDDKKNLLIGIFVAAALVVMVFVLLFLHPTTGDDEQVLYVRFSDIDKVNVGTRVTFAGRPIGEVDEIQRISDTREGPVDEYGHLYSYQLKLLIDSGIKIYDTDQFSLRTSGLLGERSVAILPFAPKLGQAPKQLTKNDIIYAEETGSVEDTIKEFKTVADKVEETLDLVNTILEDVQKEELIHKISLTAQNMSEITGALNQPEQLTAIISNIQDFSSELATRLPPSWDTFDESLDSLNVTASNFRATSLTAKDIVQGISEGRGTFGRLLERDDLYLEVKSILGKVDTVANDVNHYGLLFHLDKGWQRLRARRMNLMQKLSSPQEFRNYFNDELDQISTSLARVSMILDEVEFCGCPYGLGENRNFNKVFAELLRRTSILEESLQMYNQQVMECQVQQTELETAGVTCVPKD